MHDKRHGRQPRTVPAFSTVLLLAGAFLAALGTTAAQDPPPEEATSVESATEADSGQAAADLSEASAAVAAGDYSTAEELLAALEPEFPDDPGLLLMRGEVLLALGNVADARKVLEHGVEVQPDRPRLQFQLATALASLGERDAALEAFSREIENNTDPQVLILARLNRSMLLQQERRWKDAAAELSAVLELDPGRTRVYGDLATLDLQAGDVDAALAVLAKGKEAGFSSAQHYYSLGARLYKSERFEDAVRVFEQAIEADPGMAPAERSLAAALEHLGREDEAVAHLKRYLELRPDAPDADLVSKQIAAAEGN